MSLMFHTSSVGLTVGNIMLTLSSDVMVMMNFCILNWFDKMQTEEEGGKKNIKRNSETVTAVLME